MTAIRKMGLDYESAQIFIFDGEYFCGFDSEGYPKTTLTLAKARFFPMCSGNENKKYQIMDKLRSLGDFDSIYISNTKYKNPFNKAPTRC